MSVTHQTKKKKKKIKFYPKEVKIPSKLHEDERLKKKKKERKEESQGSLSLLTKKMRTFFNPNK